MGYCMEYEHGTIRRKKTGRGKYTAIAVIFLCGAAFFAGIRAVGVERIQNFLIPGDPVVTKAAFEKMTDDLRSGTGLSEAFSDFCYVVLDSAELEP